MIIIDLFQWCLFAVLPTTAYLFAIWATVFVGTMACGSIMILDAACELRGGYGLLQDLALVKITLAACVPVGFFTRGLARSLKDLLWGLWVRNPCGASNNLICQQSILDYRLKGSGKREWYLPSYILNSLSRI